MAIYHLTASTGSKANGQSARAKSNYITREGKYEKDRADLEFTLSGNMPEFAKENSSAYWKAADEFERNNGRLFKEIEIALPEELSASENRKLAVDFAKQLTDREKLPFTLAIHDDENGKKPHCHLMISERINDGLDRERDLWFRRANKKQPAKGGAVKTESLKPKEWLIETRKKWEKTANSTLKKAKITERIDHRSNKKRGIDREPQQKLGPHVLAMEKKGIPTDRGAELIRQERAQNERNRKNKEREIERGLGGSDGTNSRKFSSDLRRYFAEDQGDRTGFKWLRRKITNRSEHARAKQTTAMEVIRRAVSHGFGGRGVGSSYIHDIARKFGELRASREGPKLDRDGEALSNALSGRQGHSKPIDGLGVVKAAIAPVRALKPRTGRGRGKGLER